MLEDLIGEYVLNISKENLKLAALKGRIKLDNVELDGDYIGSHEDPGASVDQLSLLVKQKTVTISNLMQYMPEGTINPSTTLYNTTMYAMAALLAIAFVSNLLIGPVDKKHHMKE